MSNYYLIPVTSKYVKISGIPLQTLLKESDEELFAREKERINLTYNNPIEVEKIEKYNADTHKLYEQKDILEKLVVIIKDNSFVEAVTNTEIECENDTYIDAFQSEIKNAAEVISQTNYVDQVNRFIKISQNMTNSMQKKL